MIPVAVVTSGLFHPSLLAQWKLMRFLHDDKSYHVDIFPSLEKLTSCRKTYKAIILYFHQKAILDITVDWMNQFVSEGGGVLAIHSAAASFKNSAAYQNFLGGKFLRHGKITTFRIQQELPSYIFSPTGDFCLRDELYIHEYDEKNEIHFVTETEGRKEPVVWTRTIGKGRLVYLSLGHVAGIFDNPAVISILKDGLKWLIQGAINE